jgi:hypothetical protein
MSAAYGGTGQALQYTATEAFTFLTSGTQNLDLILDSDNFGGIGFGSLELDIKVDATTDIIKFNSLTGPSGAETFFSGHRVLTIGSGISPGTHDFSLDYILTYNAGTSATTVDGFGFTYEFEGGVPHLPPLLGMAATSGTVPEPSTWAMLLIGFVGLGFVRLGAPLRWSAVGGRQASHSKRMFQFYPF